MHRRALSTHRLRALAALAGAGACLAGWTDGAAAPPYPSRVQVVSQEFHLSPSRYVLKSGPAIVELYNLGEDDHDLIIQRVGSARPAGRIAPLRPNAVGDRELKLRPGRYVLWCSLADHRQLGMQTRITVVARARRADLSERLSPGLAGGMPGVQVLTEPAEGAVQGHLDGVRTLAKELRDLSHLQVCAVAESDQLAVPIAKLSDRGLHGQPIERVALEVMRRSKVTRRQGVRARVAEVIGEAALAMPSIHACADPLFGSKLER